MTFVAYCSYAAHTLSVISTAHAHAAAGRYEQALAQYSNALDLGASHRVTTLRDMSAIFELQVRLRRASGDGACSTTVDAWAGETALGAEESRPLASEKGRFSFFAISRSFRGSRVITLTTAVAAVFRPVWIPNIQPDFNVCVLERFGPDSLAVLRELDESHRCLQKSAESTSI